MIARTDTDRSLGHRGLSAFLVEKPGTDKHEFCFEQESGGRLTGRSIPTIGYRGMHSYDLVFEDYFVPAANLIGGAEGQGRGFYLAMAGLTGGRSFECKIPYQGNLDLKRSGFFDYKSSKSSKSEASS